MFGPEDDEETKRHKRAEEVFPTSDDLEAGNRMYERLKKEKYKPAEHITRITHSPGQEDKDNG